MIKATPINPKNASVIYIYIYIYTPIYIYMHTRVAGFLLSDGNECWISGNN